MDNPVENHSKKNLLIYASFGEGHKRAAVSLQDFLNAPCKDFLSFCPAFIRKIYSWGYRVVTTDKLSFIWELLFRSAKKDFAYIFLEKAHKIMFHSLFRYLKENNFQTVVSTHFFPSQLIALVKEELNLKLITFITDLRTHPLWISDKVDFYFAAAEETKRDLINLGVEERKIICGFVPLRKEFLIDLPEHKLREKFSLDRKPSLLFVSSVRGNFPFIKDLIFSLKDRFNIFIIYGRNKKLKNYLLKFKCNSLKLFPFYEDIWELFSLSSMVITKPGGLTIFEGLFKKKLFIFTHYIPGQEKENMDLLIEYGIAKYARDKNELIASIKDFQEKESRLKENYPIEVKDARNVLKDII